MATINTNITSINPVDYATKTYRVDQESGRIGGWIDGQESAQQSARKIIQTERYAYDIYSNNYGVEIESLIGKHKDYVASVLEDNLNDGLTMDSRINSISNFSLDLSTNDNIVPSLTVNTIYGETTV